MSNNTLFMENTWNIPAAGLYPSNLLGHVSDEIKNLSRKVSLLGLAIFLCLSLADLLLTKILLQQSGGAIYEANPLADLIIQHLGWGPLSFFKFGMVCLVSAIVIYVAYYQPITARRLLIFGCILMTGVVGYSVGLVVIFV